MQIVRTYIDTGVFYEIWVLSVALHQKQLSNCLFARIWRNVYLLELWMNR